MSAWSAFYFREGIQISASGHVDADQSGPDFFPIPFQSVPIEKESATGQTSSSGQLQIPSILDLYLPAFIKGL